MKKFIVSMLMIFIFLGMITGVMAQEGDSVQVIEEPVFWWSIFTGSANGGLLAVTDITDVEDTMRGERLDVVYNIKNRVAGPRYRVTPCFVVDEKDICMPTIYKDIAHEVGDTYKVRITNLDTAKIPDEYCNQYVKLSGKHEVWDSATSTWVLDSYQTARSSERDNSNFLLKCSTDTCTEHDTGNIQCDENFVEGRSTVKIEYVSEDCYKGWKTRVCNVGYKCDATDGSCEEDDTAEKLNNGYPCGFDDSICKSGICAAGRCSADLLGSGNQCIDNSDCDSDTCISGKCGIKEECVGEDCEEYTYSDRDGDGVDDSVDACPDEKGNSPSGCVTNNDEGDEIVCKSGSVKIKECDDGLLYPVECVSGIWEDVDVDTICAEPCEGDACDDAAKVCDNVERRCGGACEDCSWWDKFITWLKKFIGGKPV